MKTYLQAPDFDTPPDGPIVLGHILTNPSKPYESINADDRLEVPKGILYQSTKTGLTASAKWDRELKVGIWAQILEGAYGGGIGTKNSKGTDDSLAVNALETSFIWPALAATKQYFKDSLNLPGVREFLQGSRYKKPVYMVVGLKIARKGASMTSESTSEHDTKASLMVDGKIAGGVPAEVGPQVARKSTHENSTSFEDSDDFVLAYRLRKIACSKVGKIQDEDYNKGALYGLEGESVDDGAAQNIQFVIDEEDLDSQKVGEFTSVQIMDEDDSEDCFFIILPTL
jgi:hypothetical protein